MKAMGSEPTVAMKAMGSEPTVAMMQATMAMQAMPSKAPPLDMDFGSATVSMQQTRPVVAMPEPVKLSVPDLALSSSGLSFSPEPSPVPPPPSPVVTLPIIIPPAPAAMEPPGMIEFDLGALSLDLPGSDAPLASNAPSSDPLETKLSLAEEFRTIGDVDGARALVQEVIAEASGSMKAKAQRFLAELA
jgi:pilus assembly protein FimV